jgi:hypothetical protein
MFIDDPRACPELAAGLVDASVEALVISVKERQKSLRSACTATMQELRNCARHSGSTARSGTASKTSPVKRERPLLASAPDERLVRLGYTTGTVSCVFP